MKKLFVMLAAGAMFVACGGGDKKAEEKNADAQAPAVEVANDVYAQSVELIDRAFAALANGDLATFEALVDEADAMEGTLTPEQQAQLEQYVEGMAVKYGLM